MLCGLIAKRQENLGRVTATTGRFCEPTDEIACSETSSKL